MSMRSWSEQGYGFPLFNGNNMEQIKDFILKGIEDLWYRPSDAKFPEVIEAIKAAEKEMDIQDALDNPVACTVADIINRKEDARYFAGYQQCSDTDVESHIGIKPLYPWEMSGNQLTIKEQADELLKKYATELGITEEPGYFDLEYFG